MIVPSGVAVTGAGVVCSTASDVAAFSRALREGVIGIEADPGGAIPHGGGSGGAGLRPWLAARIHDFDLRSAVSRRGDLPEAVRRAALRVAGRAPLPVRVAVTVAVEAWESAGLHRVPVRPDRIGLVVAGHNLGGRHAEAVRPRYTASPVHLSPRYALHFMDTDHVGTVSQVLGITGEGYTVGGASASGNVAIVNGSRLVRGDAVDVCLVLGAVTDLSAMELQAMYNLGAMAGARPGDDGPDRRCRPFDAGREGFVPGQGAACLVLESAASAARRGIPVWGRVAGYALGLDGNSLADPSVAGESRVMAAAIARAGLVPEQIGYVNTHGTGSVLGDEVEVAALRAVFGPGTGRPWLNSTKGLVGHCLCAAGVVEALAALVQMRGGFVHGNANLDRPIDPGLRFVGARARPADPGYALSNGFGFGGFNSSVVFAGGRVGSGGHDE